MRRGDVFRLRLGRRQGHEQAGVRYGVIVQSDALMRLSTVLIAPTSTAARDASFRPEIEINGVTTRVLVEQTGAVDVSRLGDHQGHLTVEEQWGVDLALQTVLDLQ
ncbi:MAG: type II toxin-antitoxin system PemK/MazF family toxin [Nitriliruptoraceae bacterium]|nr:type II toxin-antitoxin system PemK/MazF family toxin [Nitriliruptoraceae bacterium]